MAKEKTWTEKKECRSFLLLVRFRQLFNNFFVWGRGQVKKKNPDLLKTP